MGISTFPNVASPIKSVQRGVAVSAGSITITAVNTAKTMVNSFSTSSAGTVAARGDVAAANGTTSGISTSSPSGSMTLASGAVGGLGAGQGWQITTPYSSYNAIQYLGGRYGLIYAYYYQYYVTPGATGSMSLGAMNTNGMNVAMNSQSLSGGTTDLTAAVYGAYLSNSTTLVVTGPCRYEVIEHY